MMTGAWVSGVTAIATFVALLMKRIAVEQRALETAGNRGQVPRGGV
jgi:hypothetical protein